MSRISNEASHIDIASVRIDRRDLEEDLQSGEIDLAIDVALPLSNDVRRERHRRRAAGRAGARRSSGRAREVGHRDLYVPVAHPDYGTAPAAAAMRTARWRDWDVPAHQDALSASCGREPGGESVGAAGYDDS